MRAGARCPFSPNFTKTARQRIPSQVFASSHLTSQRVFFYTCSDGNLVGEKLCEWLHASNDKCTTQSYTSNLRSALEVYLACRLGLGPLRHLWRTSCCWCRRGRLCAGLRQPEPACARARARTRGARARASARGGAWACARAYPRTRGKQVSRG